MMGSTRVYLSEDTKEALRTLAEERGTSQSALIREALDSFLEEKAPSDAEVNSADDETIESLRAARGIWTDRENVHERSSGRFGRARIGMSGLESRGTILMRT